MSATGAILVNSLSAVALGLLVAVPDDHSRQQRLANEAWRNVERINE
jgi:hypothetical protein